MTGVVVLKKILSRSRQRADEADHERGEQHDTAPQAEDSVGVSDILLHVTFSVYLDG